MYLLFQCLWKASALFSIFKHNGQYIHVVWHLWQVLFIKYLWIQDDLLTSITCNHVGRMLSEIEQHSDEKHRHIIIDNNCDNSTKFVFCIVILEYHFSTFGFVIILYSTSEADMKHTVLYLYSALHYSIKWFKQYGRIMIKSPGLNGTLKPRSGKHIASLVNFP